MNNVGIVGTGKSAENFIKALNKNPKFKLVAIGGRDKRKAKKIAKMYSKDVDILSINSVIKSTKNDLVIVCLPGSINAKIIIKLFRANKNIICEKPLTIKYSDAQKILKEQKKSKKIALVNFCYNFLEPIKVIQNEIYKNKVNLHTVNVYWQSHRDEKIKKNWKNYNNQGSGVLYNYGSHLLNLLFPKKVNLEILSKAQFCKNQSFLKKFNTKSIYSDQLCNFSIFCKFNYNFYLSNITYPTSGIRFEIIGSNGTKYLHNFKSKSSTSGFQLISLKLNKEKIISKKVFYNSEKNISIHDLYYCMLNYYSLIKKRKIKSYRFDIKEAAWNTYLLEKITNYK